ncbi:MAG: NADH-quinone oxidoreductase subunit J [Holophagales bacterium]|jgi:NADH-quinone oxidoreductase subunit J|nr:NADH-quinone oxidoreductase subunit J [Holophagales bacterium]
MDQFLSYINQFFSYIGQHLFLIFGLLAVISAAFLVFAKNAVHSVLTFLAAMICIAACYLTLQSEFLAVAQLLIYAGGIVVLFLFVVMLVELSKFKENRLFQKQTPYAVVIVMAGVGGFMWMFRRLIFDSSASIPLTLSPELSEGLNVANQNAQSVSRGLFTGYLLPFETMSVILLIALIGAIVLAKQSRA